MKAIEFRDLFLLAALWGASFLFMRMGAADFGPIPLIELRVLIAGLFLLPWLIRSPDQGQLWQHKTPLFILGAAGSAIPFTLIAYSTLFLSSGFASILNATTPLFGALVGVLFYQYRFTAVQLLGLLVGLSGVALLVWDNAAFPEEGGFLAVMAGLGASFSYGIAANYSKSKMSLVNPLVNTCGSQMAAAILLLPFAIVTWPSQMPPLESWIAVTILGVLCTGFAFLLYFRLITRIGPHKTITVTYLIPAFAMVWGAIFLDETVTINMITACLVILLGTALSTDLLSGTIKAIRLKLSTTR
ncbi:MAG: DMT family transporter [Motiliproteus sp.]|nr:DMT family transporter [Motiliproteus sp.]MCW9051493.1 DMT family transporter [Motiliproteus sp.]